MFPITLSFTLHSKAQWDALLKATEALERGIHANPLSSVLDPSALETTAADVADAAVVAKPYKPLAKEKQVKEEAPAERGAETAPVKSKQSEYDLPAEWFDDPKLRAHRVLEAIAKGQTFAPLKPEVTYDMLVDALIKLAKQRGRSVALALLKKYGAEKLTDVALERYREFGEECRARILEGVPEK